MNGRRSQAREVRGSGGISEEDQKEIDRLAALESAARNLFRPERKILSDRIREFVSTLGEAPEKAFEECKTQAARLAFLHGLTLLILA